MDQIAEVIISGLMGGLIVALFSLASIGRSVVTKSHLDSRLEGSDRYTEERKLISHRLNNIDKSLSALWSYVRDHLT